MNLKKVGKLTSLAAAILCLLTAVAYASGNLTGLDGSSSLPQAAIDQIAASVSALLQSKLSEISAAVASIPKGDTGAAGAKGDKGDKGDTGSNGAAGAAGAKGDSGAAIISKTSSLVSGWKQDTAETAAPLTNTYSFYAPGDAIAAGMAGFLNLQYAPDHQNGDLDYGAVHGPTVYFTDLTTLDEAIAQGYNTYIGTLGAVGLTATGPTTLSSLNGDFVLYSGASKTTTGGNIPAQEWPSQVFINTVPHGSTILGIAANASNGAVFKSIAYAGTCSDVILTEDTVCVTFDKNPGSDASLTFYYADVAKMAALLP